MSRPLAHVCGVCHQPLTGFTDRDTGLLSWFHVYVNDTHEPLPVPRVEGNESEVRPVCDFCNTPGDVASSWVHSAAAFDVRVVGEGFNVLSSDDGNGWGACGPCHNLLVAGDDVRLAARSASLMERRTGQFYGDVLPFVLDTHGVFFATSTGGWFPAREYRP